MFHLACVMRQEGETQQAAALAGRAAALVPHDAELAAKAQTFINAVVPRWHFDIVRDAARNAAYDAALRRAIGPNSRVLDIGAGTGLLAMMAARAGAAAVVTCEMNPAIAAMAADIVARNGFADRVRVVANRSDALDIEADLGGPVDILVSEIVSNDLLGENVLPAHERAVRDFLKPGGRVIPARGCIRVALAEYASDWRTPLGVVDGFDLSAFNAAVPHRHVIKVGSAALRLRSEPSDLLEFDFAAGAADLRDPRRSVVCRSAGGRVNVIAQWIALQLDDQTRYENRPGPSATSCWGALVYRLPRPIDTAPGQEIRVFGWHDRHQVTIWCDPAAPAP